MEIPIATFIGKSTFWSTELSSTVHSLPVSNNTNFLAPTVSFRHYTCLPLGTWQITSPTTTTPYMDSLVASWTLYGYAKPPFKTSTPILPPLSRHFSFRSRRLRSPFLPDTSKNPPMWVYGMVWFNTYFHPIKLASFIPEKDNVRILAVT